MENIFSNVGEALGNIPDGVWALFTATGISVLLQKIKKWFESLSENMIMLLLTFLSFVAAMADYLIGTASTNPGVVAEHTSILVGLATVAYRVLVKPSTVFLQDVKATKEAKKAQVAVPQEAAPNTTEVSI